MNAADTFSSSYHRLQLVRRNDNGFEKSDFIRLPTNSEDGLSIYLLCLVQRTKRLDSDKKA